MTPYVLGKSSIISFFIFIISTAYEPKSPNAWSWHWHWSPVISPLSWFDSHWHTKMGRLMDTTEVVVLPDRPTGPRGSVRVSFAVVMAAAGWDTDRLGVGTAWRTIHAQLVLHFFHSVLSFVKYEILVWKHSRSQWGRAVDMPCANARPLRSQSGAATKSSLKCVWGLSGWFVDWLDLYSCLAVPFGKSTLDYSWMRRDYQLEYICLRFPGEYGLVNHLSKLSVL